MFYVFQGALPPDDPSAQFIGKWCDAWEVDRINGEAERCPLCGHYVSSLEWLKPRKIRLTNKNYPDRLSTWLSEPLVVSERFVDAYHAAGLIGINDFVKIDLVKAPRANSPQPPNYYCAKMDYSTNIKIDYGRSEIYGQKNEWSCELCNPPGTTCDKVNRLVLDTEHWCGEDVLQIYGHGLVFSQRFYDFICQAGFTNFDLVPVDQYRSG